MINQENLKKIFKTTTAHCKKYIKKQLANNKARFIKTEKITGNSSGYMFIYEQSKKQKKGAIESVKQNGVLLQHVHKYLKNDKDVVIEAVKQNGRSLTYASKQLQNDKEIILAALNNYYIKKVEDIYYLFGDDIKKLIHGTFNIDDVKFILKAEIEKTQLNKNVANTKQTTKLNKI